jgi:hypothetical protein
VQKFNFLRANFETRGLQMRRRKFIAGISAAAWPLAARGQQPNRARRVGFLHALADNDPVAQARLAMLREGLARLGWTERNVRIEERFAGGDAAQMQAYAGVTQARDEAQIEAAVSAFAREPGGGLIAAPEPFINARRALVIALAERYRLPVIYGIRYFTKEGGLISYGPDTLDIVRRLASFVDRVLRGERPGELPVQVPIKFELLINLTTAKVLNLIVPSTLLARADEVIE